jgi:cytochrome c2
MPGCLSRRRVISFGSITVPFVLLTSIHTAAAKDGRAVYDDTCVRCHGKLEEQSSWHLTPVGSSVRLAVVLPQGPTLTGIVGRPAGIIAGYKYYKGMREFAETGAVWDRETLDKLLTNSREFLKGTFMIVKMVEDDRELVLDYLEQVALYRP